MYKNKRILAIIPARGGSKGLPGKNIRNLCGKPLIMWSVDHARESKYIDSIFVSTDSHEIADIVISNGLNVPELRPEELASDTAPSSAFIIYTLNKLEKEGNNFDYFILLEPTSPLRDIEDVDNAIEMLVDNREYDSVVGVCKAEDVHPAFMVKISDRGNLLPYENEMKALRRQDLPDVFFFEGSVYVSSVEAFKVKKAFYHDKTLPYIVPKYKSFEVDDIVDFTIIESIMKLKLEGFFK